MRITKTEAVTGLREQGRGIAGSAAWLRLGKVVVIGQLALSLPLLVGAGLLVRTLVNLQRVDLGYPKDDVLTVRVDAQPAGYEPLRQAAAFDSLLTRIRALPGVRAATYSNNGLFGGSDNGDQIASKATRPKGTTTADRDTTRSGLDTSRRSACPCCSAARSARTIAPAGERCASSTRRSPSGSSPAAIRSACTSRRQYADQRHTYEVVGVVRDSRQNRLRGEIEHRFYVAGHAAGGSISGVTFIDPSARRGVDRARRRAARRSSRQSRRCRSRRARTVTDAIDERIVQDRLLARLSIAFGVVAVLLAAIGLYGVLSYGVARRTNEIGIRKALGAQQGALDGDDPARDGLAAAWSGWLPGARSRPRRSSSSPAGCTGCRPAIR